MARRSAGCRSARCAVVLVARAPRQPLRVRRRPRAPSAPSASSAATSACRTRRGRSCVARGCGGASQSTSDQRSARSSPRRRPVIAAVRQSATSSTGTRPGGRVGDHEVEFVEVEVADLDGLGGTAGSSTAAAAVEGDPAPSRRGTERRIADSVAITFRTFRAAILRSRARTRSATSSGVIAAHRAVAEERREVHADLRVEVHNSVERLRPRRSACAM